MERDAREQDRGLWSKSILADLAGSVKPIHHRQHDVH